MKPTPRIYGLVATEAPIVALLVQQSTKWVTVFRLNTLLNTLERGACFTGKLYERRCDLSPDGVYLCTYLMRRAEPHISLSKLPWVFGLDWWHEPGTHGRGYSFSSQLTPECISFKRLLKHGWHLEPKSAGGLDNELRRGWSPATDSPKPDPADKWHELGTIILERRQPRGRTTLRMVRGPWSSKGPAIEGFRPAYSFTTPVHGGEVLDDAAWADWLADGRLVFSTWSGTVGLAKVTPRKLELQHTHDLTDLPKTRTRAPEWARK